MTAKSGHFWQQQFGKLFPWGRLFAERRNFESGYFPVEAQFVHEYVTGPSSILVIGSGNGREARPISRDGHRIVCIDIGSLYLLAGRQMFATEGVRDVDFVQADMYDLPFAPGAFDFIFFTLYSSARDRRWRALSEVHRLLRPSGHVMVMACNLDRLENSETGEAFVIDSPEDLRADIAGCPARFEMLSSDRPADRDEYLYAILKPLTP
jgi:SAM-dependent methyltransferase